METIDYSPGDLSGARFVVSPLGHLIHGVHDGPCSRHSPWRQRWWTRARRQVSTSSGRLVPLINRAHPDAPAFLPLAIAGDDPAPSFEQELDQLRATPPHLLGFRLATAAARTDDADRLIRGLRNQEDAALRTVVDGLLTLYRATLMADWPEISQRLRGDIALRDRQSRRNGTLAMLTNLHPDIMWRPIADEVRDADAADDDPDDAASGTGGLILAPCLFGQQRAHAGPGGDGTLVVIYPAAEPDDGAPAADDHLAALLGPGRAAALRSLQVPASTSDLARRLAVSVPTASTHAALLRNAGLVATTRDGKSVRHELTPVGRQLVELNPGRPR
ncbi:winged helix-turn-helix domain-containing protein [Catenulispora subtropica]|uniref:HTH arsR-type domain-containing protein n=1 Tax=Catenulispora subtropica TaxID=450798 RepID=A0ABP5EKB7_9ACTN